MQESPFSVKYFMTAVLFVLFDIEIVFFILMLSILKSWVGADLSPYLPL